MSTHAATLPVAPRQLDIPANKPAHIVLIVGERHHSHHLMNIMEREVPAIHSGLTLAFMPIHGPEVMDHLGMLAELADLESRPDKKIVFMCNGLPPELPCIEAALSHLGGRTSVMLLETDEERLLHELYPLPPKKVDEIKESVSSFNARVKSLMPSMKELQHKHHHSFSILEHRKSIKAQAHWGHMRISLHAGLKIPRRS